MPKLWGGRFSQDTNPLAAQLNASISVDFRMAGQDVTGSIAWAKAIEKAGVIDHAEADQIIAGLKQVLTEIQADQFVLQPDDEDVHTAVERRLTELIGPVAGKLHTGRSRNDQVMTDFNLWLKSVIGEIDESITGLQQTLIDRAEKDLDIIMPGYTHLQRAQPILLSHWWLSHFWPLQRDRQRLDLLAQQSDVMPLGSGALSGAPFPIDRELLAADLGFAEASPNSLDAVSNRDSAASCLFDLALLGVHLSRLAEALILFATSEFGFVALSDAYTTGSSLMPQKKNPDMLELIRGKAGTLAGKLAGLLTTLKGLPSAYDKDLQEDKQAVFEAVDIVLTLLPVMTGILDTLTPRAEKMLAAVDPSMLATELADVLVAAGVPFREAHRITGQVVAYAQNNNLPLDQVHLSDFHPAFGEKAFGELVQPLTAINRRNLTGGTGRSAVKEQIAKAKAVIG